MKNMEAVRLHKIVDRDGAISAEGLPCKKGQSVEMILLFEPEATPPCSHLTARQLIESGIAGLWKNRKDIQDSTAYARQLRERAQRRE